MKKIIFILSLAALSFISCVDMLDTAPSNQIASGNMWTTEQLADKGMAGLYRAFYPTWGKDEDKQPQFDKQKNGLDRWSIESLSFTTDHYQGYHAQRLLTFDPKTAGITHLKIEWKFGYTLIHQANDAIANLHKAGLAVDKFERYQCEARFIRAFAYHRLNMLYQGVPVYLEPVSNDECTRTQSSADEVWDVVLDDLKYCIDNQYFPNHNINVESNFGRPSKGAAYALRGMVYMWKARLDPSYYALAAADFEQVGECGYGLWNGRYIDFFKPENEKSREMIFAIQHDELIGYTDIGPQIMIGAWDTYGGWGQIKPSADFVDSYKMADGSDFEWSKVPGLEDWDKLTVAQREVFFLRDGLQSDTHHSKITTSDWIAAKAASIERVGMDIFNKYYIDNGNEDRIVKAYENRDPRLQQTVLPPYHPIDCYVPGVAGFPDGVADKEIREPFIRVDDVGGDIRFNDQLECRGTYMYKKFVEFDKDRLDGRNYVFNDWPLIRYTDVLLQWAEALAQTGKIDKAIEKVNMVRTRAGMPPLTEGGAAPNGVNSLEEMMERIRYESRVELCAEGVNFFHEIRWGTWFESKFQGKEVYGHAAWWGRDDKNNVGGDIWYYDECLWPWTAPISEVQKNPNLTRRPGWVY